MAVLGGQTDEKRHLDPQGFSEAELESEGCVRQYRYSECRFVGTTLDLILDPSAVVLGGHTQTWTRTWTRI